ncbi:MAG: 2,3-bisphosphoglycerate-independent phosphoglycerate mutase [Candidatus Nomurabacteria bacterium]|jgi:2,3-bisphosphoglycerate-independent phosphoglycerate mutase|nr:2,3-bisphosphoglycerate-independent phosphoglycerate mutase [Candidatus Nomurabacteria bacterium]
MEEVGKIKYAGPVTLVIMDGVGLSDNTAGNAFRAAHTPNLDKLMSDYPMVRLQASGEAVGVAAGNQGNSEVGHYAIGSGQIIKQGAVMVDEAVTSGRIFEGDTWRGLIENVKNNGSTLHFIGIFSDGNVHSNVNHLYAMLNRAKDEGVHRVRIHILLDGRDVPATSALEYVDKMEEFLSEVNAEGFDYRIASGGGRTFVTADRYWSNPDMVERGWQAHVLGEARPFRSTREAIEAFRAEKPNIQDQDLPPFTITDDNGAIGTINDGDSVVYFDFRADRAIEFSEAMTFHDFDKFDRQRVPQVYYAGMVEYDQERHIPQHTLVAPVQVSNTLAEFLVKNGISRFVISEAIKFGHVTFYFNGNKVGRFSDELEEYVNIAGKSGEVWQFPWMKSDEITDVLAEKITENNFRSCLVNYPNGDMVGHTSNWDASIIAMEAVDLALGRLMEATDRAGGILLITADHGNIEELYYLDENGEIIIEDCKPKLKTSHTTNPVPFIFYDNTENADRYRLKPQSDDIGLSNIAATVAELHGLTPPSQWRRSLIEFGFDKEDESERIVVKIT